MTRDEKRQIIQVLRQTFQQNQTVLLLTFSEINVPDLTALRRQVREAGNGYRVVKNTLAIRAAEETPVGQLNDDFEGPTAVAFSDSDPTVLAKILKEFADDHPGLVDDRAGGGRQSVRTVVAHAHHREPAVHRTLGARASLPLEQPRVSGPLRAGSPCSRGTIPGRMNPGLIGPMDRKVHSRQPRPWRCRRDARAG